MTMTNQDLRRQFLRYLLASPALAATPTLEALAQDSAAAPPLDQMLNVFDFEALAKQTLPASTLGLSRHRC
jgi:hypothetical protein